VRDLIYEAYGPGVGHHLDPENASGVTIIVIKYTFYCKHKLYEHTQAEKY